MRTELVATMVLFNNAARNVTTVSLLAPKKIAE
jgi:hypothetical protein